jgi:hypothetical protein
MRPLVSESARVAAANLERRQRILETLRKTPLEDALARDDFRQDLEAEAKATRPDDPDALITPDVLEDYLTHAPVWRHRKAAALLATRGARVIVVPGFLGSALRDTSGPYGLIWVDPTLIVNGQELNALKLASLNGAVEQDALPNVQIQPSGCVPLAYDLIGWFLWMNGYSVSYAPYDWRKDLDESARDLERMIRDQYAQTASRVRLIAHSQGSLVARRALQRLGVNDASQMVQMLILLGPATFGTFTAAMALSGGHEQIEQFRRYAINAPKQIEQIFQSMTGLYQLLPWKQGLLPSLPDFQNPKFWRTNIDEARLDRFLGWGKQVDARFFNDRTRIILGDADTITSVKFDNGRMIADATSKDGDGTVPDAFAKIEGVLTYKAPRATHALLAANVVVCRAVVSLLSGTNPNVVQPTAIAAMQPSDGQPVLQLRDTRREAERRKSLSSKRKPVASPVFVSRPPPEPPVRRLRVFATDPLLASSLETTQFAELVLELKWNDLGTQPAPVGEYVEVVDVDPQSGRYYPSVDLNHPFLLAQDGLKPSEKNPQFHQQMTFAVAMTTIHVFEQALGRVALWSPRLQRGPKGEILNPDADSQYVPRLRLYPHAMRQRNAYYDPDRKAILFGYFPAESIPGARVSSGSTIFTSTSFDIIAHETTHALLDGLHRYLIYPSNPDVLAFHEGFADIVALLQRFSHRDFLRAQIARADGDLTRENLLGQLAGQFAEGTGSSGRGLREYLGKRDKDGVWRPTKPDPLLIQNEQEPHARGTILVAAVFEALVQIYKRRSEDLVRLARYANGSRLDVSSSPELVERLAGEAATSAQHLLRMCIRALDYLPPVDLTLGEYLRALLTADYDLVRNDDRHYRVAVVDGFRQWGIYPSESGTLLESDLLWQPPENSPLPNLIKWIESERRGERFADWVVGADRQRAFRSRYELGTSLHQWLVNNIPPDGGKSLGICLDGDCAPGSIKRDSKGRPTFEVHAVHPCFRIGPDGQQLQDLVIEIVQRRKVASDLAVQEKLDRGQLAYDKVEAEFYFRGGCTLIVDGHSGEIRYAVRKGIAKEERLEAERAHRRDTGNFQLADSYFQADERNPFRLLHQNCR